MPNAADVPSSEVSVNIAHIWEVLHARCCPPKHPTNKTKIKSFPWSFFWLWDQRILSLSPGSFLTRLWPWADSPSPSGIVVPEKSVMSLPTRPWCWATEHAQEMWVPLPPALPPSSPPAAWLLPPGVLRRHWISHLWSSAVVVFF